MAITVIVRFAARESARLTFDGTQRVIIGRGAGSDVRLPDRSVSHRHASLRAGEKGGEFVLIDEGSTNGTFIGDVRISPHTSRIVRSGDMVRVGRLWLELKVDRGAVVTRDVAALTRDLALALVSQAMSAMGEDLVTRVRVVEGRDQGRILPLVEDGREYVVGRAEHCDLALADTDASREHVRLVARGGAVFVRDLGAKNGTWIGDARAPEDREVPWRPALMIKIGRTVLALEEPVGDALAAIERASDDPIAVEAAIAGPPAPEAAVGSVPPLDPGAVRVTPVPVASPGTSVLPAAGSRWSATDRLVMAAAVGLLALSLAGLVWLLRG